MTNTETRDGATLTVPAFNPLTFINAPAGATHFRLLNAVSVISDYAFNSTSKVYEPINTNLNELSEVVYSDYLDLTTPLGAATTIDATLQGPPTMTSDVSVLSCVGIEFYQKVGSEYYLFNSGNAMKIQNIF